MVTAIKKYKSKNVETFYLEVDAQRGLIGMEWIEHTDPSPMDELWQFRDLAYHVGDHDKPVVIEPPR
jgi:hypothetical protein